MPREREELTGAMRPIAAAFPAIPQHAKVLGHPRLCRKLDDLGGGYASALA